MDIVRIAISQHSATGLLMATSPDLPGLSIAAHTVAALEDDLIPAVAALLSATGVAAEDLELIRLHDLDEQGFIASQPGFTVGRRAA